MVVDLSQQELFLARGLSGARLRDEPPPLLFDLWVRCFLAIRIEEGSWKWGQNIFLIGFKCFEFRTDLRVRDLKKHQSPCQPVKIQHALCRIGTIKTGFPFGSPVSILPYLTPHPQLTSRDDFSIGRYLLFPAADLYSRLLLTPSFHNKWCRKSTANHSFTSFGSCR